MVHSQFLDAPFARSFVDEDAEEEMGEPALQLRRLRRQQEEQRLLPQVEGPEGELPPEEEGIH